MARRGASVLIALAFGLFASQAFVSPAKGAPEVGDTGGQEAPWLQYDYSNSPVIARESIFSLST